jgi:methyltransferase (TIGR00027 family)
MQAARPSRTAYGTAFRRAFHQLHDAPPLVFDDPIAVPILGPTALPDLHAAKKDHDEPFNLALRAFLVARSRYTEDLLAQAVGPLSRQPVRQYVLLGAGLDTFAHRNPHPTLHVFEVDHPATQAWKRQLVAAAQLPAQPALTYAPVDFESESLPDRLAAVGFDLAAPAFFAWLGVVPYLTLAAFRATVDFIAQRPSGSGLVFDYGQPRHALPLRERLVRDAFAARVAQAGEPFQLHFTPKEAAAELHAFFNLEDLGSAELNSLHFANRTDKLRLHGQSGRIVSAWL